MSRSYVRHPRRWLGAAVLMCLAADLVAFRVVGNRVAPVSVATAVARFRASQQLSTEASGLASASTLASPSAGTQAALAAGASPLSRPSPTDHRVAATAASSSTAVPRGIVTANQPMSPGVYTYTTQGYEKVDVLGGSRHDYPDHTTITVTPNSCGNDVRWDGLEQRWDQWSTCASGHAIGLRGFVTYHDFYGQVLKQTYACDPGTQFRPETTEAGTAFPGRCSSGSATADITGTVVGVETVPIAGRDVAALHVRLDEKLTGDTRGTRTSDSWYALSDGLLLRRSSLTDADTQATFGSTHYHEELSITAVSLTPEQ